MRGSPAAWAPSAAVAVGVIPAAVYLIAGTWAATNLSYDVSGGILILPALALCGAAIFYRAARRDGDAWLAGMVPAILAAKLAGTVLRYAVIYVLYGGESDARQFDEAGKLLAVSFRGLAFDADVGKVPGTGFMELLSGGIYTMVGPTRTGAFLCFSFLSLLGCLFIYRAFRLALPDSDHRRYGLLLFFLPSMFFWPSSTGKEAWMLLTIGVSAYGAARLLRRSPGGLTLLAAGLAGSMMMRPHVALALILALAVAYAVRGPERNTPGLPVRKVAVFLVLILGAVVLVDRVEGFFNVDSLDRESVDTVLQHTEERNVGDRSSFDAVRIDSPIDVPLAIVTVLFRPFPWEAGTVQAFGASLESLFLLGLLLFSARRVATAIGNAGRMPYVLFAVGFLALFVYAFSSFGNFGLLARQRVQALPFLLVLLAFPDRPRSHPPAPTTPAPGRTRSHSTASR